MMRVGRWKNPCCLHCWPYNPCSRPYREHTLLGPAVKSLLGSSAVGYTRRSIQSFLHRNRMVALVETIWLFVRGSESVRLIRAGTPEGRVRLLVYGPGNTETTHEFQDAIACAARQSEIERRLISEGFALHQFTDRRSGLDRRS